MHVIVRRVSDDQIEGEEISIVRRHALRINCSSVWPSHDALFRDAVPSTFRLTNPAVAGQKLNTMSCFFLESGEFRGAHANALRMLFSGVLACTVTLLHFGGFCFQSPPATVRSFRENLPQGFREIENCCGPVDSESEAGGRKYGSDQCISISSHIPYRFLTGELTGVV